MADTIKLAKTVTLKHQSNLGEDIKEIEFEAGHEFSVLKEWDSSYLAKDEDGNHYDIKKDLTA